MHVNDRAAGAINARTIGVILISLAWTTTLGCVNTLAADSRISATAYDISVSLNPENGAVDGQAKLTFRYDAPATGSARLAADFSLNRAIQVSSVTGEGVLVHSFFPLPADESASANEGDKGGDDLLSVHRVFLDGAAPEFSLTFKYSGVLRQDISAGEREGEIHNFAMAAHVGPEGIFLEPSGGWYPFLHADPDAPPSGELAMYRLEATPIEGVELVAGAAFDEAASKESGRLVWRSERKLDGLALVGGRHNIKRTTAAGVDVALHYTVPEDADERAEIDRNTDMFLAAAAKYLDRYQPLIGPFPGKRYAIVESFFSSGFAFPEFTWLSPQLLQMGPRALGHGYLDHEMLHSWWGNGVYVDPADGNWCEALASYGANYYGYILDEDEDGARKYRRNACNLVTALEPDEDKPLGLYGREGGPDRGVGYNKGAMVFHMLARKIGQDNFWKAMRRLTAEHTGKYANWRTLQGLFEQESGIKLDRFVSDWVRHSGAPNLKLSDARWSDADQTLNVTLDQQTTDFELAVPLRIVFDDGGQRDEMVNLDKATATVAIQLDRAPKSVVLDPDYQIMRKLHASEIMPTARTTSAADRLLVVTPAGEISPFYDRLIKRFEDEDHPDKVTRKTVDELKAEDLPQQALLIIGDAAKAASVQEFLTRANCPIAWSDSGFGVDGQAFDSPADSVLCTVHHPDIPGAGVTIYYGNSEDAIGRSDLMLFYTNSLVAFETTAKESAGEKQYDSRVVLRKDFEQPMTIAVQR